MTPNQDIGVPILRQHLSIKLCFFVETKPIITYLVQVRIRQLLFCDMILKNSQQNLETHCVPKFFLNSFFMWLTSCDSHGEMSFCQMRSTTLNNEHGLEGLKFWELLKCAGGATSRTSPAEEKENTRKLLFNYFNDMKWDTWIWISLLILLNLSLDVK